MAITNADHTGMAITKANCARAFTAARTMPRARAQVWPESTARPVTASKPPHRTSKIPQKPYPKMSMSAVVVM